MTDRARDFLVKHNMLPEGIQIAKCAETMSAHMKAGLEGNAIDMPMIPTYLKGAEKVPQGRHAIVIDAGGTNYRRALASFDGSGCKIEDLQVCKMPGTGTPCTWDEFICFVIDSIMPLTDRADVIGFCFSYSADITPDMDGKVQRIDKEVVVTGCEGKLIGASMIAELEKRGVFDKKVIILNDTVAALLGGSAELDKDIYSDFVGMICGTGINTCAPVSQKKITKLGSDAEDTMIINLESGCYSAMPAGDIDAVVDAESVIPGEKLMEKMCSGAYVGTVLRTALLAAEKEGCLHEGISEKLNAVETFNGAVADALACGDDKYSFFINDDEKEFAKDIAMAIFKRSARCMCTNILAIMYVNDSGKDAAKPACVCAEGSLIGRSRYFLPFLEESLKEAAETSGRYASIVLGHDTTLPGSAVAALLNA